MPRLIRFALIGRTIYRTVCRPFHCATGDRSLQSAGHLQPDRTEAFVSWPSARALLARFCPSNFAMSLSKLSDDSLLLIFEHLSALRQLNLRLVSWRFCHLLESHSLRAWKMVSYFCLSKGDYYIYIGKRTPSFLRPVITSQSAITSLTVHRLPRSLPQVLPSIEALLIRSLSPLEDYDGKIVHYLSSWSSTLVTLHLNIPQTESWAILWPTVNKLSNLRHLKFHFFSPSEINFIPDTVPIFGQLNSLSLSAYCGTNGGRILSQLGPNLITLALSLNECHEEQFLQLCKSPAAASLKELYFTFKTEITHRQSYEPAPEILSRLVSLTKLRVDCCDDSTGYNYIRKEPLRLTLLGSLITALAKLPCFEDLFFVAITPAHLRALPELYPQRYLLPQLPTLKSLRFRLSERPFEYKADFKLEINDGTEFIEQHLPTLAIMFANVEEITIECLLDFDLAAETKTRLETKITARIKELFGKVRQVQVLVTRVMRRDFIAEIHYPPHFLYDFVDQPRRRTPCFIDN